MAERGKARGIDADLVRELADLLEETGLAEIEYGRDGWHVRVSRGGGTVAVSAGAAPAAPGPVSGAAQPAAPGTEAPEDLSTHPGAVTSPMVGVVYTSPDPGAAPFVKVGDEVDEGDTLLLIEAMKVFNPIRAPRSGRVTRIMVSSGTPVEYGEPLLIIE